MKTALLVIDLINGVVNGTCKEYISKHPVIENANIIIDKCRKENMPIYFIRLAFDASYKDIPKHSKAFKNIKLHKKYANGDDDVELAQQLHYNNDDIVINKTAVSPFYKTGLENKLRSDGVERLIFTGLATDNAINLGVREAHDRGFYTVIAKDACGASSVEFHQESLMLLDKIAGEIIMTSDF
jgi:nicotinamidase-related amidase